MVCNLCKTVCIMSWDTTRHGLQHTTHGKGGGGWIKAKKRDSPGFRPPEVSISAYQVELSESAVHAAGHQGQENLVI